MLQASLKQQQQQQQQQQTKLDCATSDGVMILFCTFLHKTDILYPLNTKYYSYYLSLFVMSTGHTCKKKCNLWCHTQLEEGTKYRGEQIQLFYIN